MRMTIHKFAGAGIGAALAIMLSVDVEAAPMNTSQAPAEISASDGLVVQVTTRTKSGVVAIVSQDKWSTAKEHRSTGPISER